MKNIVIVIASEQQNLELAKKFEAEIQSQGAKASIINIIDLELPMFTSRTESKYSASELLNEVTTKFSLAHGFVFLAPEYNGGTPPAFSNFLAWLSRTSKNWREHLNGRSAVIGTFSAGGGVSALSVMRTQLAYLGMNILGRQIITNNAKPLDQASLTAVVSNLLKYAH